MWTDAQDQIVADLANTTEYKEIACLVGKSIGAVCAKVKRMRDEGRIRTPFTKIKVQRDRAPALLFEERDPEIIAAMETMEKEANVMAGKLVTLAERADDGCCYVVGDPKKTAHCYCPGTAMPGSSYCATHHARVWLKVPVRGVKKELEPVGPKTLAFA